MNKPKNSAVIRWLLQPKRIPLLYSATIIASIFYHYAPAFTPLWIILTTVFQAALFRLFDFVKKHNFIGGIAYLAAGFVTLAVSVSFMYAGYYGTLLAPKEDIARINPFVWFMTPQSVLTDRYPGYTIALFLMFSFFLASIAYYFTFVRYRVLMSFMVMIFPFAIYAKENETMPVPSIIILFVCYFAVMIYCRQAHTEDPELVQAYEPNGTSRLTMPPKKSANADKKPELIDKSFIRAGGIFLAAASIAVLIIPKPTVTADRTALETMLDISELSSYLENAISGFTDSSDGGSYSLLDYNRTIYYANSDEQLNLRVNTYTNYDYDSDSWFASDYDGTPKDENSRTNAFDTETYCADQLPTDLLLAVQKAARLDSAFAEKWNLTEFAALPIPESGYLRTLKMAAASYNAAIFPAPNHAVSVDSENSAQKILQSSSGIFFRRSNARLYFEEFTVRYYSETAANSDAARMLMQQSDAGNWADFLSDLLNTAQDSGDEDLQQKAQDAADCYLAAQNYAASVKSQTPAEVRELAASLTEDCVSDFEKASALYHYMHSGEFIYDLDFPIDVHDNVETFLFQNKTGVCYQFASAMTELCRAAGLPTRYVEGFSLSRKNTGITTSGDWEYVITSDEAHAFVEIYISGYGWMMLDPTASSTLAQNRNSANVIATLQYSGFILFGAALLVIAVTVWLIPMLREKLFRRKYRRLRNAEAVQAACRRLRKQWNADPAVTMRDLCRTQSDFLQCDLSDLLSGFEETLYANRCTPETADRVYTAYCQAYDAWKPAVKREKAARRQAEKTAETAGAGA